MQLALPPILVLPPIFTPGQTMKLIVAYLSSSSNTFIYHLHSLCTIFDGTNYVTWSASFQHFLHIYGHLSYLTNDPPPFRDPTHTTLFMEDQVVMAWLIKLGIHSICEPIQLITPAQDIWDKWAFMYGYEFNISWIDKVYEQLFKAKSQGVALKTNMSAFVDFSLSWSCISCI